ncbi:MAG: hypothetical protein IKV63_00085 [Clostridia bacterium]|nr:hypothetical protein [Clostridia bacterium]
MRKTILILIAIAIIVISAGLFILANSIGISTGVCIKADNGRYLILLDNSPVAMHQRSGEKNIFENLDTGDRILAVHSGVMETFPGKMGVYFLIKLDSGHPVPDEAITQLKDLGWMK